MTSSANTTHPHTQMLSQVLTMVPFEILVAMSCALPVRNMRALCILYIGAKVQANCIHLLSSYHVTTSIRSAVTPPLYVLYYPTSYYTTYIYVNILLSVMTVSYVFNYLSCHVVLMYNTDLDPQSELYYTEDRDTNVLIEDRIMAKLRVAVGESDKEEEESGECEKPEIKVMSKRSSRQITKSPKLKRSSTRIIPEHKRRIMINEVTGKMQLIPDKLLPEDKAPEKLPVLSDKAPEKLTVLKDKAPEKLPVLSDKAPEKLPVLSDKAPEKLTVLKDKAPEKLPVLSDKAPEKLPVLSDKAPEKLTVLKDKAPDKLPVISDKAPEKLSVLSDKAPEKFSVLSDKAPEKLSVISDKVPEKLSVLSDKAPEKLSVLNYKVPKKYSVLSDNAYRKRETYRSFRKSFSKYEKYSSSEVVQHSCTDILVDNANTVAMDTTGLTRLGPYDIDADTMNNNRNHVISSPVAFIVTCDQTRHTPLRRPAREDITPCPVVKHCYWVPVDDVRLASVRRGPANRNRRDNLNSSSMYIF